MMNRRNCTALLCTAMLIAGNMTFVPVSSAAAAVESVPASGECGENVFWEFDSTSGTLRISGQGEMSPYSTPWYDYKDAIQKVEIENGVTSIGGNAFSDCPALTDVSIPDSVTSIGYAAFNGDTSIVSVDLPNGITVLSESIFAGCSSLQEVDLPEQLSVIETRAFDGCEALRSVSFPAALTEIGAGAFQNCSALTAVTLPDRVSAIRGLAFHMCSSLTSVTLPENITSISSSAFDGTPWYDSLESVNGLVIVDDILLSGRECKGDVIIPDTVRMIARNAFSNCGELTSVSIPESVVIIDHYAFSSSSLPSIVIPDSVEKIGYGAFYCCASLTDCTLPAGIRKLDHSLFEGCASLKSITIPDTVTEIGYQCFASSGLTSIELPDSVKTVYEGAFMYCTSLLSVKMTDSVTNFGELPDEQDYIGEGGLGQTQGIFCSCTALKDVRLSDSLTELGGRCFENCTALEEITLPEQLTDVYYQEFWHCSSLSAVTFPAQLQRIGNSVFTDCGLTAIHIPAGAETIDIAAFAGCPLQKISVDPTNRYFSARDDVLFNKDCTELLLYPCEKAAAAYKVPVETITISKGAFAGASKLEEVTLTGNVISIGESAFSYCAALKNIWIYNPYCQINGWGGTVCNEYVEKEDGFYSPSYYGTIHGYKDSTAQEYANTYSYPFASIGEMPESMQGDVNADGSFSAADIVLLQKWLLAVPDTYLPNWKAADLCNDDKLSVFDLCLMKRTLGNL